MRKGQTKGEKGLTRPLLTRVTQAKYEALNKLVEETKGETMSSLVRKILEEKPVRIFYRDETLDLVMEELAAHRAEIRKIGVNINQMTKLFHSYPELKTKLFYARNGFERYLVLEEQIEILLEKINQLAKRWLSE